MPAVDEHGLTVKQRKFVDEYMKTNVAATAYRSAYNTEKMTQNSIYVAASQLLNNPKITAYLDHLKRQTAKKTTLTLETGVERLIHLADQAEAAGNHAAAVTAMTNAMKAIGVFVEKTHNMNEDLNQSHLEALRGLIDKADNVKRLEPKSDLDADDVQKNGTTD